MSFKFDMEKVSKQMTTAAVDRIYTVVSEAKRELGADGTGIGISRSAIRRTGDKLDLGAVTFPTEEVKNRFLQIVKRRMR